MSKRIATNGPQMTGAQALDIILAQLDAIIYQAELPYGPVYPAAMVSGFKGARDRVYFLRANYFDDPKTEDPMGVLSKARYYR